MKRNVMSKICAVASAWLLGQGIAHADTVLYNEAGFIQGQESYVQSFDITSPGTLTVTLTNIPWLDTISNLSGFLSNSRGEIGGLFSDGGESVKVSPGMVYAHWFGDALGPYGAGVFGIKVTFEPAGQTVVPVPGTVVLLLSGLILVAAASRRLAARTAAAQAALTDSASPSPAEGVGKG